MDHVRILLAQCQGERHVFINGHVAVQGVALEYHCHVSVLGRCCCDVFAVQQEFAVGNVLKACDHTQRSGLSASGRTDQNDQFSVFYVQIEVKDCLNVIIIYLIDML